MVAELPPDGKLLSTDAARDGDFRNDDAIEIWLDPDCDGRDLYQFVAPTLCDSTAAEGICWSVFMVRAHGSDSGTFYDAEPDSGYSVDNLEPSIPTGLHLATATSLAWDPASDADFDYFTVYGSTANVLDPGAVVVGHTIGTSMDLTGHEHDYYLVTATDFNGNESEAAVVQRATGVGDLPVRHVYALENARPNPFNPRTTIGYSLAKEQRVFLRVYDLSGRLVRTLVNGELVSAGSHQAIWDGVDAGGHRVASGVYFYRLDAGDFEETKRMTLVK
jgi:hypothetical protein